MGKVPAGLTALLLLLVVTATAFAQVEQSGSPLPAGAIPLAISRVAMAPDVVDRDFAERAAEAAQWAADFTEWKQWDAQWRNRRQPGWFTGFRDRQDAPIPPVWLSERCRWVFDSDPLMPACTLLREWTEDYTTTQLRQTSATVQAQREGDSNITWWEHLHIDMLWPAMQVRSSMYGVIGMHAATTVHGRVQAFVAPGMMVLNLPSRSGARTWKVAANYGIGYRLFDFVFPGKRLASLHVNAARAWVISDVSDVVTGRTVDFAGFSLTFKKNP
jgi:hypothetical protein